jgi:multidrug efflux system outer membrane protein
VDAVAGVRRERFSEETLLGVPGGVDTERTVFSAGASMYWELDLFGRIRRATEAERALLYAAENTRRAVVIALVSDVARAYVELRDLDRRLEITEQTVQSRRDYVELVRVRFEGGVTSELDYRQSEGELHRTLADAHDLERQQLQKENEINLLLGRNPAPIPRGSAVAALPLPPEIPAGLPAELLQRRPDLAAAEDQLIAANARIGEARRCSTRPSR